MSRATRHDKEQDRLARDWSTALVFTCSACHEETPFPVTHHIATEVPLHGFYESLRADTVAYGDEGEVLGTVEVIDSHEPSEDVLASEASFQFAFFRYLPQQKRAKNHRTRPDRPLDYGLDYDWPVSMGKPPKRSRPSYPDGAWLCSVECLRWWQEWGAYARVEHWEAPKCDACGIYLYENTLNDKPFRSWAYDPYTTCCIHCAAKFAADCPDVQWREPGELAGGDPREWTPDEDAGPSELFMAWSEAAFWEMVWREREGKLGREDVYDGHRHPAEEDATARRLPLVYAAFDVGEWGKGANLLLPIGSPGWQANPGEPERLLAFRPDNCRGTALAWSRLLGYRLEQLPLELVAIITQVQREKQSAPADFIPEPDEDGLVHEGYPDGRFTKCGIDRWALEEDVIVSRDRGVTCGACR